jgi:hypothetical protein
MREVSEDFIKEALQARYDQVSEDWATESAKDIWENGGLDYIAEGGVGKNDTPMTIVDNFLVNSETKTWEEFLDEEAIEGETEEQREARKQAFIDNGDYVFYTDYSVWIQ